MRIIVTAALAVGFLAAVVFGGRWALMPLLQPPQGLHSGTETDLIRDRYPRRLIDPSSLNMTDDEVGTGWVFAETKVRSQRTLFGLAAYAAIGVGVSVWMKRKTTANKPSHHTA